VTSDGVLAVWVFPRELGHEQIQVAALAGTDAPELRVHVLSSTGDSISVQVVEGVVPLDPDAVLYVQRRGPFEIKRRDVWPGGRVLLTLDAWPRRKG
jgi:hypothetical protein